MTAPFSLPSPCRWSLRPRRAKRGSARPEDGLRPDQGRDDGKGRGGFSLLRHLRQLRHTVDFTQIKVLKVEAEKRSREEIDEIIRTQIGRKLVVLGACTGYDAHTVGIDAIINMKGFAGDYGLERYQWLDARNLGAQVLNDDLLKLAVSEKADAILVSKVVTQHNIHIEDMKDLIIGPRRMGLRDQDDFCAGGPRVTHPMALECGFDAGFGVGTKPSEVASYIVEEVSPEEQDTDRQEEQRPTSLMKQIKRKNTEKEETNS